jgi:hypothetical protein
VTATDLEWRTIPIAPKYEASSDGRIRTVATGLVRALNPWGTYLSVTLYDGALVDTHPVHRLVAMAFHGLPEPGQVVRHLDGDSQHNASSNLAWGTQAENVADAMRHGTHRSGIAKRTHCVKGHPLSGDNLRIGKQTDGSKVRLCITCRRESNRRYEQNKKKAS